MKNIYSLLLLIFLMAIAGCGDNPEYLPGSPAFEDCMQAKGINSYSSVEDVLKQCTFWISEPFNNQRTNDALKIVGCIWPLQAALDCS